MISSSVMPATFNILSNKSIGEIAYHIRPNALQFLFCFLIFIFLRTTFHSTLNVTDKCKANQSSGFKRLFNAKSQLAVCTVILVLTKVCLRWI